MHNRNAHMSDELDAIYQQTVEFVAKEATSGGEAGQVPREVLRAMGYLGMSGLRVPVERGGCGARSTGLGCVPEALGSSTFGGFDVNVLVHTDMSSPRLINSGGEEQLSTYLPGILSGECIVSIGVIEPDAGSASPASARPPCATARAFQARWDHVETDPSSPRWARPGSCRRLGSPRRQGDAAFSRAGRRGVTRAGSRGRGRGGCGHRAGRWRRSPRWRDGTPC